MVESATGKVRYASVALVHHAADDNRSTPIGSVLVPIGAVRRLDHRHAVAIDALTSDLLVAAPRLHARPVTRADEDATLAVYGMATSRHVAADALYDRPQFDEGRLMLGAA
jgi:hypothetical protein